MDAVAAARKQAETKARLKRALLQLLETRPYHDISVPEIVYRKELAKPVQMSRYCRMA